MIGAQHLRPAVLEELPTELADRHCRSQEILGRATSPADDVLGIHDCNLSVEILAAVTCFLGGRQPISGRATAQDVANVNIFTLKVASLDDVVEQLPRPPDERFALFVLVSTWRFTHEQDLCFGIADTENRLRPSACQFVATNAFRDFLLQHLELCNAFRLWQIERLKGDRFRQCRSRLGDTWHGDRLNWEEGTARWPRFCRDFSDRFRPCGRDDGRGNRDRRADQMRHAGGAQRFQVLSQGSRGLHAVVLDHGDEFSTESGTRVAGAIRRESSPKAHSTRIVREEALHCTSAVEAPDFGQLAVAASPLAITY